MYQKPYHEDGFDCTYGGETLCSACEENESEREFIDQTANDLIYKFKYYPKICKTGLILSGICDDKTYDCDRLENIN